MAHLSSTSLLHPRTQLNVSTRVLAPPASSRLTIVRHALDSNTDAGSCDRQHESEQARLALSRREVLSFSAIAAASLVGQPLQAQAIQGLTAGRIPGLSKDADEEGFFTYMRPEGKSGGHGVGWSEIPTYKFKVPAGWDEIPVSIADLGGTEIDLRYQNKDAGEIAVVVAPVLRFMDLGFNAKVTLREVGTPQRVIEGFAPELFGRPLDDEDVLATEVKTLEDGGLYYMWELKPHNLVAATATKNRVFILTVSSNARQWKKHGPELRKIQQSFRVKQEA